MITMRGASVMIAAALCASVTLTVPAQAFDLNGAWASSPENCAKIFTRKGSQIAFSDNSDIYGGGFIVAGNRIVGKTGQCRIKARKEDGKQIHLISECASDIMYQNMQRTHPTSAVLSDAGRSAKRMTLSLALRSSGDAGRGVGRVGAAAQVVAG